MNRADVELLNSAMGGLAGTLQQNRALAQRANEAEMERELRERMLQEQIAGRKDVATQTNAVRQDNAEARKQHFEAEMQHWKNMEGAATGSTDAKQQQLQERAKEFAHKQWDSSINFFSKQVKDGLMQADQAQVALGKAFEAMPDQTKQMLADNPSVQALQSGSFNFQNPAPKAEKAPAAVATVKAIQGMEDQADFMESAGDQAGADYTRNLATLMRQHLQKNPPAGLRKSITTKDQRTGSQQTLSGPAGDVDAAMGGAGPRPATVGPGATAAGGGTAGGTLKFVRDPKTGKLVPQMAFQPPLPPPPGVDPSAGDLSKPLNLPKF